MLAKKVGALLMLAFCLQAGAVPWQEFRRPSNAFERQESLINQQLPWAQTSLVFPNMISDLAEIDALFDRFKPGKRHPLCWTQAWPVRLNPQETFSLFPFLMRRGYDHPIFYPIPFVATLKEGFGYSIYQNIYADGPCAGQSYLEADFKGTCPLPENSGEPAFVVINSLPEVVQNFGSLDYRHYHLPRNGVRSSYTGLLYEIEPRLLGFSSNSTAKGFRSPLTTFDRRLYSRCQKRYINEHDSFEELSSKCHQAAAEDLCFAGSTALMFLGHLSDKYENPADKLLRVSFTKDRKPVLALRNTLLSDSEFVNYGFYTEAELLVLQDLDYKLNSRDFYGFSIYTSGTPERLASHLLATGYAAWDDDQKNYNHKQYSRVPLGVGAHIYGSYNQVEQLSDIVSAGTGAIGVRIDGTANHYKLNRKYAIYEQGQQSAGITVAYGHNTELFLEGTVAADSSSGIGILCSYGSNLRSDLLEYQGSYHKVRTYDYKRGVITKKAAQKMPLPDDLKGPLVKRIVLNGALRGGKAAISIAHNAHVEEIYFKQKAQVIGDLISEWNPYESEGEFYLKPYDYNLLPAQLQLESRPMYEKEANFNLLSNKLKTRVIFGAENYLPDNQLSSSTVGLKPDEDAYIDFSGNIEGASLDLYAVGGQTSLRGSFKVSSLEISTAVLHLDSTKGKASTTDTLVLKNNGVLDLVNSLPNTVIVEEQALIDNHSVIHLDINENGATIDRIWFNGTVAATDNKISIEPGLNFEVLKRFSSDPKALYVFIRHFMVHTNHALKRYGLQVRFPRHIWLDSGDLGREIRCGIHDCHIGRYVAAHETTAVNLPWWRYLLSGGGLVLLMLLSYLFMKGTFLHVLVRQRG